MPLNLYRRHQGKCEANRTVDSRSGEVDERKKGWKRCGCFIFASGNLSGTFKRKSTGRITWDEAKAVAAEWEKARSWDGQIPSPPAPLPEPAPSRIRQDIELQMDRRGLGRLHLPLDLDRLAHLRRGAFPDRPHAADRRDSCA